MFGFIVDGNTNQHFLFVLDEHYMACVMKNCCGFLGKTHFNLPKYDESLRSNRKSVSFVKHISKSKRAFKLEF